MRFPVVSEYGETRPISLRSQVCSSSGVSMKSNLPSTDCSDLRPPTRIIFATSLPALLFGLQCAEPGPADLNLRVKKIKGAPIRQAQPRSQKQSRHARKEAW